MRPLERVRGQAPARPELGGELWMNVFERNAEAGGERKTAELVAAGARGRADDQRLVRALARPRVVVGPGEIDDVGSPVEPDLRARIQCFLSAMIRLEY